MEGETFVTRSGRFVGENKYLQVHKMHSNETSKGWEEERRIIGSVNKGHILRYGMGTRYGVVPIPVPAIMLTFAPIVIYPFCRPHN